MENSRSTAVISPVFPAVRSAECVMKTQRGCPGDSPRPLCTQQALCLGIWLFITLHSALTSCHWWRLVRPRDRLSYGGEKKAPACNFQSRAQDQDQDQDQGHHGEGLSQNLAMLPSNVQQMEDFNSWESGSVFDPIKHANNIILRLQSFLNFFFYVLFLCKYFSKKACRHPAELKTAL